MRPKLLLPKLIINVGFSSHASIRRKEQGYKRQHSLHALTITNNELWSKQRSPNVFKHDQDL